MVMKIPAARVTIPDDDKPRIFADFEKVLSSGRLTLGPFTEQFERAYADMLGVNHAVAVNSGTSALEIIFRSIGVKGKTVIIPTNTFFATPAAAIHAGARVEL